MTLMNGREFRAKESELRPCDCGRDCGKYLEPRVDGERPTIAGREVNPDCYADLISEGIDGCPIVAPRSRWQGTEALD